MSRTVNVHLKEEREKRGWSQARVAEQIGAAVVNVSRWERGYSSPSPYFREKLCQLYGKDAQDLGFLKQDERTEIVQQTPPWSGSLSAFRVERQNEADQEKPQRTSRILACAGYLLLWLSGLFVFLFAKEDRFARFHSLQSMLFFGGSNLLSAVILAILGAMLKIVDSGNKMILTIGFTLLLLVLTVVNLFTLIGWVVGMVQAYRGNYYSFPFVRGLRERNRGRDW